MNKDEIIKNIAKENQRLSQELQLWKKKYYMIEDAYNQLLNGNKEESNKNYFHNNHKEQQTISHIHNQHNNYHEETIRQDDSEEIISPTTPITQIHSPTISNNQNSKQKEVHPNTKSEKIHPNQKSKGKSQEEEVDFFAEFKFPETNASTLIEGCFIIQKTNSIQHFDPLRFLYPSNAFTRIRSMFDIIYRYTFVEKDIRKIWDDDFDSRKTEINIGSPGEDFHFSFDNFEEKGKQNLNKLNRFEIESHLMKRRYVYGLVRPELLQINQEYYQTEIAYGFITNTPFTGFFHDLNRIIQQEIKFQNLNSKQTMTNSKDERIVLVSQIMEQFVNKSQESNLAVTGYPINIKFIANTADIHLYFENNQDYRQKQLKLIENNIMKFSALKIAKILHYVLAERHIIIACQTRKRLNQIMQIIQAIIYPFNWVFPIVYFYTTFFEPFLQSPMPIIIGYLEEDASLFQEEQDKQTKNTFKTVQDLPHSEFPIIFADQEDKEDQREDIQLRKNIQVLHKYLIKPSNATNKSTKGKIEKEIQINNKIDKGKQFVNRIYKYVGRLKKFILDGKLQEQLSPFHIQFMGTQMVSYYKETLQKVDIEKK